MSRRLRGYKIIVPATGCRNPGLNQGPLDLQSNALPNELGKQARMIKQKERRWKKRGGGQAIQGKTKVQLEEINQKVLAKGRLKRYRQRVKQYRKKKGFPKQRKKILSTTGREWHENIPTTACERNRTILDKNMATKKHNENAEWINNITRELKGFEASPKPEIHVDLLKKTLKRISNWKAPGHDRMHGFWCKKFTSVHSRLSLEMNRRLQGTQVPEWMAKGKIRFIQKDPSKRTAPNNYRPITCLPMIWKILTAQIREKIYYSLTSCGLFPDEKNETYKYLCIWEADTIKQVQMKDKIRKEYLRRTRKLLETKLQKPHQRNKYLGCAPC